MLRDRLLGVLRPGDAAIDPDAQQRAHALQQRGERGIARAGRQLLVEVRIGLDELLAVIQVLVTGHRVDVPLQAVDGVVVAPLGGVPRRLRLQRRAQLDQVGDVLRTEHQAPVQRAGEQLGGMRLQVRPRAGADLDDAQDLQGGQGLAHR